LPLNMAKYEIPITSEIALRLLTFLTLITATCIRTMTKPLFRLRFKLTPMGNALCSRDETSSESRVHDDHMSGTSLSAQRPGTEIRLSNTRLGLGCASLSADKVMRKSCSEWALLIRNNRRAHIPAHSHTGSLSLFRRLIPPSSIMKLLSIFSVLFICFKLGHGQCIVEPYGLVNSTICSD